MVKIFLLDQINDFYSIEKRIFTRLLFKYLLDCDKVKTVNGVKKYEKIYR